MTVETITDLVKISFRLKAYLFGSFIRCANKANDIDVMIDLTDFPERVSEVVGLLKSSKKVHRIKYEQYDTIDISKIKKQKKLDILVITKKDCLSDFMRINRGRMVALQEL